MKIPARSLSLQLRSFNKLTVYRQCNKLHYRGKAILEVLWHDRSGFQTCLSVSLTPWSLRSLPPHDSNRISPVLSFLRLYIRLYYLLVAMWHLCVWTCSSTVIGLLSPDPHLFIELHSALSTTFHSVLSLVYCTEESFI